MWIWQVLELLRWIAGNLDRRQHLKGPLWGLIVTGFFVHFVGFGGTWGKFRPKGLESIDKNFKNIKKYIKKLETKH